MKRKETGIYIPRQGIEKESKTMKANLVLITLFFITLASLPSMAGTKPGNDTADAAADQQLLSDALAAPAALPRGPQDLIQDYSAEMAAIAQRFSASLGEITEAVSRGELSSEQAKQISAEQYEQAEMQFELLGALRAFTEHDLAGAPAADDDATPSESDESQQNGALTIALPFSSLQLNPSLSQYLKLSQSQVEAIRQLMEQERRDLQPLMTQLHTMRAKLLAQRPDASSDKQVKSLAVSEAGLLQKLILSNSHMQAKIYKVLTSEQQQKLEAFKRSSASSGSATSGKLGISNVSLTTEQGPAAKRGISQY